MIIDKAKQAGVPIEYLSKHDLNVLTDNSVHQVLIIITQASVFTCLLYTALKMMTDPRPWIVGAASKLLAARFCSPG